MRLKHIINSIATISLLCASLAASGQDDTIHSIAVETKDSTQPILVELDTETTVTFSATELIIGSTNSDIDLSISLNSVRCWRYTPDSPTVSVRGIEKSAEAAITYEHGNISAESPEEEITLSLHNVNGTTAATAHGTGRATISTDGIPSGIYILDFNGKPFKITIKK